MFRFLKFFSKEKLPELPRHLSARDYEALMPTADGFPRPDWPLVTQKIETEHAQRLDEAWQDFAHIWLTRLKHRLEGQYRVDRSREFILLSALPQRRAGFLLEILEGIRKRILDNLGWSKEDEDPGLYTVLLFADLATYQLYASGLGSEGEEAPSIGQYVSGLYTYLAVVEQENWRMEPTLAYLLAHSILDGNSLPLWLEKGLCCHFRDLYDQGENLDHAFQTRTHWEAQRQWWTKRGLQGFWSGADFDLEDSAEAAEQLALVLSRAVFEAARDVPELLRQASWQDASFAAVVSCTGRSLDAFISGFLGQGDWDFRPTREWLKECLAEENSPQNASE